MNTYEITIREIWFQKVRVKAETEEEAREKAIKGASEPLEDEFEYSHMADDPIAEVQLVENEDVFETEYDASEETDDIPF